MKNRYDMKLTDGNTISVGFTVTATRAIILANELGQEAEVWLTYEELRQLINELETIKGNLET